MRRNDLPTRPCRKTYGRHKGPERTRLIHRPCEGHRSTGRRNSGFLLLCSYSHRWTRSCGRSFFSGPAKLGAIHPHAVHDDRHPSRHSDDRALHPRCRAIFMPQALSHDHSVAAGHQDQGRLEQHLAHHARLRISRCRPSGRSRPTGAGAASGRRRHRLPSSW